jgi:hypothetical protein
VFYFLDYQYNDKISVQVTSNQYGEGVVSESFRDSTLEELKNSMLDRTNYDALINKTA